jgi:rod shape-determining protein MreD
LAVHGVVAAQKRFLVGKTFLVVWLGFALVAAGATALTWILISLFHVALVDGRAAVVQYMITVGTFPLISGLFLQWQRSLLRTG